MEEESRVLCGANSYEKKYYFNKQFNKLPQSIQEELQIMCVLFTEEVGGILTLVFDEDGTLLLQTNSEEEDIYYDEVSSGLLIKQIMKKREEMFESIQMFYQVFILKNMPDGLE